MLYKKIIPLLFILLFSCTTNSTFYPVLQKDQFSWEESPTPISPPLTKTTHFEHEACFNQWLFFNNAHKESLKYAQNYFRHLCNEEKFLLDTSARWTWWTLIFFSQSCIDLEGFCSK